MKLMAKGLEIEIRSGTVDDVPLLLSFIRSMAEFERLKVTATEENLRASLFGKNPAAYTVFAFVDGEPAAYVVYFFSFSTMVGKRGLWLDDLFVNPQFRGRGIATALMAYMADLAIQNECGRFEWIVLEWNSRAIDFYRAMGANILEEWKICRLENRELARLGRQHSGAD
jgi:GNAT superfamily N-acetyltransferase